MSGTPVLYSKVTIPKSHRAQTVQSKIYKGFSTVNTTTENFMLYDFELIKQDLINHFYTRQGERLMNPQFGTIIWDLLFEPLTEQIKDLMLQNVNEIVNYDPRVQASDVIITSYDKGIQIQYTLKYIPYNIQQTLQLRFDQQNGLLISQ
jgi:phage baseplate assembly protein W